jgi:sigma-B regulation protein RsbU (phosphoserine phosphatase)
MLTFINEGLCRVNKDSFVTAICAVYDPQVRSLQIARAGHPPPILYRPSEKAATEIPCAGVSAMGWDPFPRVPVTDVQLESGARLLFYTDGITERFSEQREAYETARVLRQMETADTDDPTQILEGIVRDLARFAGDRPADDDQAMLLIVAE